MYFSGYKFAHLYKLVYFSGYKGFIRLDILKNVKTINSGSLLLGLKILIIGDWKLTHHKLNNGESGKIEYIQYNYQIIATIHKVT